MSNSTYVPQTEAELESWMKAHCYHFNNYAVNGSAITEGCGIERFGSLFIWYYTERGQQTRLKYFYTEREIVEYAFRQIKADKWARAHCIGFTENEAEKKELAALLTNRSIEFFQDAIPYYGPGRPVYRTFVMGCAIKEVTPLKSRYYKQINNNPQEHQ